jgi:hypothetical protein
MGGVGSGGEGEKEGERVGWNVLIFYVDFLKILRFDGGFERC